MSFKKFFKEINKLAEDGFFDKMSPNKQKKLNSIISSYLKDYKHSYYRNINAVIPATLNKGYIWYKDKGFTKNNKGLRGWRLEKVKKALREALKTRIRYSLNLIKTQNESTMAKLRNRFLDWVEVESGSGKKESIQKTMKVAETLKKKDKHMKMILRDQSRKMIGNFDNIVALEYGAIGFFWKTRRDNRVVGNPAGKYPGVGTSKHQDHYDRENKFYFYHNTWVIKNRYVATKAKNFYWADFEDGLPGQPINCRCFAYNIYSLDDIPRELLSKKGLAYLEKQRSK